MWLRGDMEHKNDFHKYLSVCTVPTTAYVLVIKTNSNSNKSYTTTNRLAFQEIWTLYFSDTIFHPYLRNIYFYFRNAWQCLLFFFLTRWWATMLLLNGGNIMTFINSSICLICLLLWLPDIRIFFLNKINCIYSIWKSICVWPIRGKGTYIL